MKRGINIRIVKLLLPIMIVGIIAALLTFLDSDGETIDIWLTTADQEYLLTKQDSVVFEENNDSNLPIIQVDPNVHFQKMVGFGAAITGSSAYLINHKIDDGQRESLMRNLFTDEGIDMSFIRHTIGASDFSVDENGNSASYTYNDINTDTDYELNNFSVEKDSDVISLIQEILSYNSKIKVLGTPWTAPAWMKYQEKTLNGGYLNYNDNRVYTAYANYLVKYVKAYKNNGIPIHAITIQNEPEFTTSSYPTMSMNAEEQSMFIKEFLGPAFLENKIQTKIIAYDHNWENAMDYANTILDDPQTSNYTDGTAYHCYEGEPSSMSDVHDAFPDKNIYLTECSGGAWSTDFGNNLSWYMSNLMIGGPRNWAKAVLLWNVALNENGGPTNGGCTDCRGVVTVNQDSGEITQNVEYYAIGHASKFVNPGAVRIASTHYKNNLETVAYKNPDSSIVLIVANTSTKSKVFQVNFDGESFTYKMDSKSAATFKWMPK